MNPTKPITKRLMIWPRILVLAGRENGGSQAASNGVPPTGVSSVNRHDLLAVVVYLWRRGTAP